MRTFYKNPIAFLSIKLPDKIKVNPEDRAAEEARLIAKGDYKESDLQTYINNELSRLIVKALNQANKFRLKYPTLSVNSTALKLVALCLKSGNPLASEENKVKFKQQTKTFISDCLLAKQVEDEYNRRGRL